MGSRSKRWKLSGGVIGIGIAVLAILHGLERRSEERVLLGWSVLAQCMLGKPLFGEASWDRIRRIQQTRLDAQDPSTRTWPVRCAESGHALERELIGRRKRRSYAEDRAVVALRELVDAFELGGDRRIFEKFRRLLDAAAVLGWRAAPVAGAPSAPAPAAPGLRARPWPSARVRLIDEGWLVLAPECCRGELLRVVAPKQLEQDRISDLIDLVLSSEGTLSARSTADDPVCFGVRDADFHEELEGPFKLRCSGPIPPVPDLLRHVEVSDVALAHGRVIAALRDAPRTVVLYDVNGNIANTSPVERDSFLFAGYLFFVRDRWLWARAIQERPARLGEETRIGQGPVRARTWGDRCAGLVLAGSNELDVVFALDSGWSRRKIPAFGQIRSFRCTPTGVSILQLSSSGELRHSLCTPDECKTETANLGIRGMHGEPVLTALGSKWAVLWRTELDDVRVRSASLHDLAHTPDTILFDDRVWTADCKENFRDWESSAPELESSGRDLAVELRDSALLALPNCQTHSSHLIRVTSDGVTVVAPPPELDFESVSSGTH